MLQSRAGPPLSAWELSLGSSKNRFVSENLTLRLHASLAGLATEGIEIDGGHGGPLPYTLFFSYELGPRTPGMKINSPPWLKVVGGG